MKHDEFQVKGHRFENEIKIDSLDQLLICNAIKTAVSFTSVVLVCVKNLLPGENILLKRG